MPKPTKNEKKKRMSHNMKVARRFYGILIRKYISEYDNEWCKDEIIKEITKLLDREKGLKG
jgi:hypothetical protein